MNGLDSLICRFDASDPQQALWESCGLLPSIMARQGEAWITASQHDRLRKLTAAKFDWSVGPPLPDDLFAPTVVAELGAFSCLTQGAGAPSSPASPLWMQLLPLWIADSPAVTDRTPNQIWREIDIDGYRAYSLNVALNEISTKSVERHQSLTASRSALFARSANYMGSKAALASQLLDIVNATESPGTTMVDLMCGSGVMASAFARQFPTIASDAQEFCRVLGLVQGGGMTSARGEEIAQRVIHGARRRFNSLSDEVRRAIDDENLLVNSELTVGVTEALLQRLHERLILWEAENLGNLEAVSKAHSSGGLLGHLYGGVFFGDRQAAELDCLRQSISDLPDEIERRWALGALVCAASACAYTYGGHFAQPKLNISDTGKSRGDISEALKQRSLSITHEFFTRLTSLAMESENVEHAVSLVAGPWEDAIRTIARTCGRGPVCVYIDPPYTRDEYSRYYHVLEALVRYQPQAVSGKGRLPKRGSAGRFASKFSGRRADLMEAEIARMIQTCLAQGWNCLWSYSDSGVASIDGTLARLEGHAKAADVFCMDHSYKAQGKRGQKRVVEYAIHLCPGS
jgi:adenine-specific DNA-methyltransferase